MAIIIGTSGYDYPEWVGGDRFYPPSLGQRRSDWLTYYASRFPVIELNFTYYGATSPQQVESMLRRTEPGQQLSLLEGDFAPQPGFSFVIKTYATLTHQLGRDWRSDAAKFSQDIAPLVGSGRLAGVLAQFPSRFRLTRQTLSYCVRLGEELSPARLIVEPRHREWFTAYVRTVLAEHGVTLAGVDAPEQARMPRAMESAHDGTPVPLSYVRMHGRREGSWWSGDAASRYEYRYNDYQLADFANQLVVTSGESTAYVLFNNHRHADAAQNARKLTEIVDSLLAGGAPQTGT